MAALLTSTERDARTAELAILAQTRGVLIGMCASCGAITKEQACERPSVSHGICNDQIECLTAWGMTAEAAKKYLARIRGGMEAA